ncbi:molybdenum cofactor biosynthesis protein 1 [Galendromus occidentalis]|uniref:Molybdenum cofactor biosynthesis protein 1 n=1 Tax=Galendromus occidentalis TaxID=34638 RepID=A0AAJ6VVV3_9ACAR|nr:molybdenum cofactor biosynthesis protein 1 [Galendromus occidentalis]
MRPIFQSILVRAAKRATSVDQQLRKCSTGALVDSHGRVHDYLRISLTEKCSFRCTYCMPDEGVPLTPKELLLTSDELKRLIDVFVSLGVTKVRLTGGEPLLRKDIVDIVRYLRSKVSINKIGITTNGLVLSRNLTSLVAAGLSHVNISLDSLMPEKFESITRRRGFQNVLRAIFEAEKIVHTKINCVVMRNLNENEVPAFVELTRDHNIELRFIEYMPFDGNRWSWERLVPQKELEERIRSFVPDAIALPLEANHTAKMFTSPSHRGRWGFISSMSQAFCSSCNRLRLTADGSLRSCLFSSRNDELPLVEVLRNSPASDRQDVDELLRRKIRNHLLKKHFSHGGMEVRSLSRQKNRPMITIGG